MMAKHLPYYAVAINNTPMALKREDKRFCGGNCWDFINKHVEFIWQQTNIDQSKKRPFNNDRTNYPARLCERDEVSHDIYDAGAMLICPPKEGLSMQNITGNSRFKGFSFAINPRNKATYKTGDVAKFINGINLKRY
jgi:hypothetical protein